MICSGNQAQFATPTTFTGITQNHTVNIATTSANSLYASCASECAPVPFVYQTIGAKLNISTTSPTAGQAFFDQVVNPFTLAAAKNFFPVTASITSTGTPLTLANVLPNNTNHVCPNPTTTTGTSATSSTAGSGAGGLTSGTSTGSATTNTTGATTALGDASSLLATSAFVFAAIAALL
jgi:hypothetical protein